MSDQPDNSEPDDRGQPPADPNEFGKWLVDRATGESPATGKDVPTDENAEASAKS